MDKKNVKQQKPKLMSEYEHDLTWMAYRYAIGRHTIAANSMALEMAKNVYGRISRSRSEFMAMDINKEIESHLRYYPFGFSIDYMIPSESEMYKPLDLFIEFMTKYNIKQSADLLPYNGICCSYKNGEIVYILSMRNTLDSAYETSNWDDLLVWDRLSKLLDIKSHKWCVIKHDDGTEELVEYFESYIKTSYKEIEYKKVKMPVNKYIENPYVCSHICEDAIVEDELTDRKIKHFNKKNDEKTEETV